jgi:hypothetical protein
LAGIINIIAGIVLFFLFLGSNKTSVFKDTFIGKSGVVFKAINQVDTMNYLLIKSSKTFKITPQDKTLFLSLNTIMPEQAEAVYKLQVLDSKNKVVFSHGAFSCNYKKYKNGYDAIANGSFQDPYKLNNLEGTYHVQLLLEVPKWQHAVSNAAILGQVEITTEEESHSSKLFIGLGFLMLFISLFIRKPQKNFNFWHNG